MKKSTALVPCAAALALAAFAPAFAQPPARDMPDKDARPTHDMHRTDMTGMPVFVLGSKIMGMNVVNNDEKTIGSINDLIVDRGSGKIRYIVLKSGSIMGMGGKLVTVPYTSFGWDSADKHAKLNATTDEIKTWPEWEKTRWSEGARTDKGLVRTLGKDYYDNTPWPATADENSKTSTLKGKIKSITRRNVDKNEELVVVVTTPDVGEREVVLGPSWYFAGNNSIGFYRDTPVEFDVFTVNQNGHPVTVARSARNSGKTLPFYNTEGKALWEPANSAMDTDPFSAAPFLLASEVKGRPVDCRGESCGKVENLIVECTGGLIAFLSIDPDKAVLGIGDEDRLVPWGIMTRTLDGKVHLDASKSMITSAPTTPKNLQDLAKDKYYRKIYQLYGTQNVSLEPAGH